MPEIVMQDDRVVIEYRKRPRGEIHRFDLGLSYLGDSFVAFILVAEKDANGVWRALCVEIDLEDTTADLDDAVDDLADVQWRIIPSRERGRKLPPVVTFWEQQGLILAACLSDRYGVRRIPFARQEKTPGRKGYLCQWPSRSTWQATKEAGKRLGVLAAGGVAVSFYPLGEWIRRADVRAEIEEWSAALKEMESDPVVQESALAEILAMEYSRYIRRVRTALLYYQNKGVSVEVVLGDTRKAEKYFAEQGLDPRDPSAWTSVTHMLQPMPEFLIEDLGSCGPLGVAASRQKLKAAMSPVSHWPGIAPLPDALGAVVYAGPRQVASLAAWINPLAGKGAVEKAVDALLEEFARRGAERVIVADSVFPFELCLHCGKLAFRVPDGWLESESGRSQKVDRNAPCPCGSGLKYKKCCGAPEAVPPTN